ncbi:DUF4145 domain-containing protein [Rhizobium johnstonii]|uniref:DUF4145 domain-containing protein n=1 Tax=Rhizobium TaxID=379 RepID=UPI00103275D0|nr:DUF4145 domain-containing protein [Rhizobium leguminosarum]TBF84598.1 DUF4145 domain-containing protein [Rhizobium leguminosarum]TBH04043.1 DUF4145 domain-containing protein [Rhizobium leguminosarum]TBH13470.1 DUF4145 domain-containing protein [Rhizobium leguminosarum]TBH38521.1 DUF4145 domain-containing protein [Rhizobium leguminosarum]TBH61240.1 DUF4145 domain-containing protein [Rhizobium leguminosarum]
MELQVRGNVTAIEPNPISVRCPVCRQNGAFHGFGTIARDIGWSYHPSGHRNPRSVRVGMRVCPNKQCESIAFFAQSNEGIKWLPPEVLDFDGSNLPARILASLEEAIKCHSAGCYRASALMVRRVLEELCEDKNATGRNLKDRIAALSAVAIIPPELLTAADELRILGNDAAHIEAKDYDAIGQNESELAIELAKELLKAVYQYTSLVSRLQALKKQP